MHHELSKREKKIARTCIDKGLQAEFNIGLKKFEGIIRDWQNGKFTDNKEAYHSLYVAVDETNKHIARRYDHLTGTNYLVTVAALYNEGLISAVDFIELSAEAKAAISRWVALWNDGK